MNCESARAAIELHFTGGGDVAAFEPVRLHLESCATCRELYERLARVDAVLERGGLAPPTLEALEGRVLARVGAAPKAARARPSWPRGVRAALLAAAAVLVAAVPVWLLARRDEFQPRGGGGATFGVRAFCVSPSAAVTGEARPGQTLRCPPGSSVQFTYTAPRAVELSVALAGTDLRFFPAAGERAVVDAGVDVALPLSTQVGVWLDAPKEVLATFTDAAGETVATSSLMLDPR